MTDPAATPQHSDAEEAMLQQLYVDLKPQAMTEYVNYFLVRTPPHLQGDMTDIIKSDLATPPTPPTPPTKAV
jgi:hypothetical protein